jgi:hypothetical protein
LDEINKPIKSNKPGGKTETMSLAKYEQGIYISISRKSHYSGFLIDSHSPLQFWPFQSTGIYFFSTEFENLKNELSNNNVSQPIFLIVQAWVTNARIDHASRARKQVFTTPQSGGHFRTSYEDIHCARAAPQAPHRFIGALYATRELHFFAITHSAAVTSSSLPCLQEKLQGS